MTKKRNAQDTTLRNNRALKKRILKLEQQMRECSRILKRRVELAKLENKLNETIDCVNILLAEFYKGVLWDPTSQNIKRI